MGPSFLDLTAPTGDAEADHRAVAALIEPLVCGDIARPEARAAALHPAAERDGGILDDLMVGRPPAEPAGRLYIVVNAGTKEADFAAIDGGGRRRAPG